MSGKGWEGGVGCDVGGGSVEGFVCSEERVQGVEGEEGVLEASPSEVVTSSSGTLSHDSFDWCTPLYLAVCEGKEEKVRKERGRERDDSSVVSHL